MNLGGALEMGLKEQAIRDTGALKEPRALLLRATGKFVRAAKRCAGVRRIALIGSLVTAKVKPKDTDLLLTI